MASMAAGRPVVLSSALLTDRMILWSSFTHSRQASGIRVCTFSSEVLRDEWEQHPSQADAYPATRPVGGLISRARQVNQAAWERRVDLPSRRSFDSQRATPPKRQARAIRRVGRAVDWMHLTRPFDHLLAKGLEHQRTDPGGHEQLMSMRPSLVVTTVPFWGDEANLVAAARRARVPTAALITSWDNITTKRHMSGRHDAFFTWTTEMTDQLRLHYPWSSRCFTAEVGAPQFDVFWQKEFHVERGRFLQSLGLDPSRRTILYALGSPNFLDELPGAVWLADEVEAGTLGDVQMVVRPHPVHHADSLRRHFADTGSRVVVQEPGSGPTVDRRNTQLRTHVVEWVNTFRHCDVLVNLASTATIDSAINDRPVISLDFDPAPGGTQARLIADINRTWSHWSPIARSGGLLLAADRRAVVDGIRAYLANPALHRTERKAMVRHVIGEADGRSGERLAEAIAEADRRLGSQEPHRTRWRQS